METNNYINQTNYINVKTVEALPPDQRHFKITGEGYEKEFKALDGTVQKKPTIPVEGNGKQYEWTLGYKAIIDLSAEFDSSDTLDWVGATIKLLTQPTNKGSKTVTATVIHKQQKT